MTSQLAVRIGCQRPRVVHLPADRQGSAGPEAVECARLAGLELDDWQQWVLDEALSEQSDGQWSAFEVAALVGRQSGKGAILEARQLVGLFLLGERLQVHTAHEFKTCFEHFLRVCNLIEGAPEFDRRVSRIRRGAGEQAIELKGGERLRFLARSGGSGRGMSGDVVYLDEAFALTPGMMGALLPTLSARPNPQVWYTSSAPLASSSVLHGVRDRGHAGTGDRLFFAEWGCERGVEVDDRDNWYVANPALGIRISEDFIAAELEAMRAMPDEFARERLGVPDLPPSEDGPAAKLPADAWEASRSDRRPSMAEGEVVFGYDVHDGWATICAATGTLSQGWVEVTGDPATAVPDHRSGVHWLPARLVELVQRWKPRVVGLDGGNGPALGVLAEVREAFTLAGLDPEVVQPLTTGAYKAACESMFTGVKDGKVHRPRLEPDQLHTAGVFAAERTIGDQWLWDRRCKVPVSPLVAATIARSLLAAGAGPAEDPFFFFS